MPFQKGVSGNPHGRPRGTKNLTPLWKQMHEEIDPDSKKTKYQTIVDLVYEKAKKGNEKFVEIFLERVDGKVSLPINVSQELPVYNYEALTDDELLQLEDMTKKLGIPEEEHDEKITYIEGNTSGTMQEEFLQICEGSVDTSRTN